jgi:hypothetical protein
MSYIVGHLWAIIWKLSVYVPHKGKYIGKSVHISNYWVNAELLDTGFYCLGDALSITWVHVMFASRVVTLFLIILCQRSLFQRVEQVYPLMYHANKTWIKDLNLYLLSLFPRIGFNVEILSEIALEDFFCIILGISRQILYSVNYTAGSSRTTSGVMFRQGTHCWSINLVIWCLLMVAHAGGAGESTKLWVIAWMYQVKIWSVKEMETLT